MPITIADVAKKAGVSTATVSRVLNNKDRVKDETRQKILDIVKELGYFPNSSAKRLRDNIANTIGVIVPDISTSFYSEIVKGIENKANEMGCNLIVCDAQNRKEKERGYLKLMYNGSVDGMIFVIPQLNKDELKQIQDNYSFTVFGVNTEDCNIPSITVDNIDGAYQAVAHLCAHGYTRIAYIGGIEAENDYDHLARLEGYKRALYDSNLDFIPEYIENGRYTEEGGSSAFLRLMKLNNPPEAVFCANDEMALGVLKIARKTNIKIPEQVGLIGFDNIRICQYTNPPLTTVSQPAYNIGVLLCERLLQKIYNKELNYKYTNLVLKTELVIRESCGC